MNKDRRVLVVEDDDSVWTAISMCMAKEPYKAEREKNGQKALELIQKGGYDAVVLDLMLPGLSGQEMLKVLDNDPKFQGFPILINSAVGETNWTRELLQACKNLRIEVVPRPFDPLDLLEVMRKLLGLSTDPLAIMGEQADGAAGKKKVLVVDDDKMIRNLYVPYFKGKGYAVTAAANGNEALQVLKREKVHLVILDLNMPEMTGEEVLEAMAGHAVWKKIPVIIDTAVDPASGRLGKIKEAYKGKLYFDFFERPTSLEELNEAIGRILIL